MKSLSMTKKLLTSILVGTLAAYVMTGTVLAQNCGCAPNLCCSQYDFCGEGPEYCGTGCKEGPCFSKSAATVSVDTIVSPDFFNGIINSQTRPNCDGKRFYTRQAFLTALESFRDFGKLGSDVDSKREIAAFFAHATHETDHFCFTEEEKKTDPYCDPANKEFPCAPGKFYYGRGPIQITGNVNYGKAGNDLKLDLLNNPERVSTDPIVSFKTALWYWMTAVRPFIEQGFGATTNAINGKLECNGGPGAEAQKRRVQFYTDYCKRFGVDAGANLNC